MNIRAAVIGAGHFAYRTHIPALAAREEVTLDSVCRLGSAELALIRDEFGFAFATETWEEILERSIDIVVIASPHHLHYPQARAFLEKGCHVLVEKPMTLDPVEAWDLVDIAARRERELLVAYGWHYKPGLKALREMVRRIGTIEHVVCHMASFTREIFTGGTLPQWAHVAIQPERKTWEDPATGGGYGHGQLSHALGLLYWSTDLRAESVRAITFDAASGIDLHDAATVRFAGGATGVLSGSCGIPNGHGFEVSLRIYGTKGSALLDIETERMTLKLPDGVTETLDVPQGAWRYSCEGPANALVDIATGKGTNETRGEIGARAVETLHAMIASARNQGAATRVFPSSTRDGGETGAVKIPDRGR